MSLRILILLFLRPSFAKLVDAAGAILRNFSYAPTDTELYKTEEEKEATRNKMFDSMDLKCTGVITFDEWVKFSMDHIISKVR